MFALISSTKAQLLGHCLHLLQDTTVPDSLLLKSLMPCGFYSNTAEMLRKKWFSSTSKTTHRQLGSSSIRFQKQQIHRGCHIHCPPWCFWSSSAQHSALSLSHEADWKLNTLGFSITLCNWIIDFLTYRPQTVRLAVTAVRVQYQSSPRLCA